MFLIHDSWKSLFHYSHPTTDAPSNECRLDVESIDLQGIDAMIRPQAAARVLYDTPIEWWYGGVLHACFDLLCNSTNHDNVRPLFPLVLSVTRNIDTRFMLGTVNYFGETPIHVITNRKKGRANTSFILYRMCMRDSDMYLATIRGTWRRIQMHAYQRVHFRRFKMCLIDLTYSPPFIVNGRSFGAYPGGVMYHKCFISFTAHC